MQPSKLVASCQWLCLYFSVSFPPSNSNVMEHRPAVNLVPNEVSSEMVTEEENKGRMSYWRSSSNLLAWCKLAGLFCNPAVQDLSFKDFSPSDFLLTSTSLFMEL